MVSIMNSVAWQECTSLLIFIKLYEKINGTILQFINKYGRGVLCSKLLSVMTIVFF